MDQQVLHFTMKAAFYGQITDSQDGETKQANGFMDSLRGAWDSGKAQLGHGMEAAQQWYQNHPEAHMALLGGLGGAAGGAALGGIHSMTQPKNKRHLMRDALIGGLSGGALGAGGGYLAQRAGYGLPAHDPARALAQGTQVMGGGEAAALAALSGNPAAMATAANSAMLSQANGGNGVSQLYDSLAKGQGSQQVADNLRHLSDIDPNVASKVMQQVQDNHPFAGAVSDFWNTYRNHPYATPTGIGAAYGAGKSLTNAIGKINQESANYKADPLGNQLALHQNNLNDANHPVANSMGNYKIDKGHPDFESLGERDRIALAVGGADGAPKLNPILQQKAIEDAARNPRAENKFLRFLEPNWKTTHEFKGGVPEVPAGNFAGPGGPPPVEGPVPVRNQQWDGTWHRPWVNEGKGVPNSVINEWFAKPHPNNAPMRQKVWRGVKETGLGAGKGALKGGIAGLGIEAAKRLGQGDGPEFWHWLSSFGSNNASAAR